MSRARSCLAGLGSTATISPAPATAAAWTMFRPTPPQPTTATESPGRTRAVFSTAPKAVMTAQPMSAISLSGRDGSMGIAVCAGTTVRSPNDDVVEWWMAVPLR